MPARLPSPAHRYSNCYGRILDVGRRRRRRRTLSIKFPSSSSKIPTRPNPSVKIAATRGAPQVLPAVAALMGHNIRHIFFKATSERREMRCCEIDRRTVRDNPSVRRPPHTNRTQRSGPPTAELTQKSHTHRGRISSFGGPHFSPSARLPRLTGAAFLGGGI